MHILVCAYACDPEGGSERHVGWAGVRALARRHKVTVLTHGWGRSLIEKELPSIPESQNLRFHFIGNRHSWHANRLVARLQDWVRAARWNKEASKLARELVREGPFDLAHHMTIATWRTPSPLGDLGLPLVWGPVGGGETMPRNFYQILSPTGQIFEAARAAANLCGVHSRRLRRFASGVSIALGNNRETLEVLGGLGIPEDRVRYLSQSFLGSEKFLSPENLAAKLEPAGCLRIFAGGNLEGRKGIALVIKALSILGGRGVAFDFTFGGLGPELGHLSKLTAGLNFGSGRVTLGKHLDGAEYREALAGAHVYLLPSLREGAPVTMIEAMAAGAVPIVADAGGAPMVVDASCGIVVPVTNPEKMVQEIAGHLEVLAQNPSLLRSLSYAAWKRAGERCMEDAYLAGIDKAYGFALGSLR